MGIHGVRGIADERHAVTHPPVGADPRTRQKPDLIPRRQTLQGLDHSSINLTDPCLEGAESSRIRLHCRNPIRFDHVQRHHPIAGSRKEPEDLTSPDIVPGLPFHTSRTGQEGNQIAMPIPMDVGRDAERLSDHRVGPIGPHHQFRVNLGCLLLSLPSHHHPGNAPVLPHQTV
jgi:hypothetical protein